MVWYVTLESWLHSSTVNPYIESSKIANGIWLNCTVLAHFWIALCFMNYCTLLSCSSFVFLQLYHTAHFGSTSEKPLLVPHSRAIERTIKNLDRIPPYETHKVGVIYVGPGQACNEAEILRNQFGSLRYAEFLQVRCINFLLHFIKKSILVVHCSIRVASKGIFHNGISTKMSIIWWNVIIITLRIQELCGNNVLECKR